MTGPAVTVVIQDNVTTAPPPPAPTVVTPLYAAPASLEERLRDALHRGRQALVHLIDADLTDPETQAKVAALRAAAEDLADHTAATKTSQDVAAHAALVAVKE